MIEYKTQKKERYYSEVIRLYTGIWLQYWTVSQIFPLSYGTVKHWLLFCLQKKNAKIMNQP